MWIRDRSIWANGPTSLEVMRYIDGLMAENSWTWLGTMQYFALNKPLVLLQHTQSAEELEDALRTAVVCGAQVHVAWEPKDKGGNKENSKMLPDSNPIDVYKRQGDDSREYGGRGGGNPGKHISINQVSAAGSHCAQIEKTGQNLKICQWGKIIRKAAKREMPHQVDAVKRHHSK